MASVMQRGFRDKLEKHVNISDKLTVEMSLNGDAEYDYCCFGVDANDKLSDDAYMVFYNQTKSPGQEIIMSRNGAAAVFEINLSRLPSKIVKLVFTANIDGAGTMKNIRSFACSLKKGGAEALRLDMSGANFSSEKAIVAVELYKKDVWRINCVASGFNGGLSDLLKSYGGSEVTPPPQEQQKAAHKVELKKGQKVNLEKPHGVSLGEIVCNLNWTQKGKAGFLGKAKSIDLDLACLYELKNGSKGAIQALGSSFGNLSSPPYIALDGDDRTGSSADGEFLRINGARISEIKRILVFTFIYDGVANWREADAVVTVKTLSSPDIIVHLDEYGSSSILCAIAMLENINNETFSVEKLVQFYNGQEELDKAHGWGMQWRAGRK
ncbi:tellurium resistance protein TerA [Synergistales bacterium]|nr:tellurium resistance protein TerA [Synergistales bacterium]